MTKTQQPTNVLRPKILRPPFKCHGGKNYLKGWVIENFPDNYETMTYVEPFAGAASVLFNKLAAPEEVINDLHPGIAEIYKWIRDQPGDFAKRLKRQSYSKKTFDKALERSAEPFVDKFDLAVNEYVLRRMSRGGLKRDFAWSERLRGGQPGDVNAWETALQQIPDLSARLENVWVLNKPATEVLRAYSRSTSLAYVDPPYLHETRVTKNAYEFEMGADEHKKLLDVLLSFRGKVVLSGYDSELYNTMLAGWTKVTRKIVNHSSQAKLKQMKTEVLWRNF